VNISVAYFPVLWRPTSDLTKDDIADVAAGGVIGPAYWAPASLIRPTPKKTPVA